MKRLFLLFTVLTLFNFKTADTALTSDERKGAVDHLTKTQNAMMQMVKGLSPAQLNYKSSPTSWSIAECAEHIALSEGLIWGAVDGALKTPADAAGRSEVKMSDDAVVKMITDRSTKFKTQEKFEPTNKFGSMDGILKEFNDKRKSHINFVKTTKEDLRNRYAKMPFGTLDAYQAILFLSAHSERHTQQMAEVKADAGYPKK